MIPTIVSVTPSAGHTGGKGLIEIQGTGFALPAAPLASGTVPAPIASVLVTVGGIHCRTVWAVSSTLLRALTPKHAPSGARSRPTPDAVDVAASDVTVQNLDAAGVAVPGELATRAAAYSFQRPLLDARTLTQRTIEALVNEIQLQVHPNVSWNPHTDCDALSLIELAYLPGIALTELRLPRSESVGDREQAEVPLANNMFAVRRAAVVRDIVFTVMGASDNSGEMISLEASMRAFGEKTVELEVDRIEGDPSQGQHAFKLDYARSEPVMGKDRAENVVWFQTQIAVRRVPETDMPGIATAGVPAATGLQANEATLEIGYTAGTFGITGESIP